jgi:hypothetical protein
MSNTPNIGTLTPLKTIVAYCLDESDKSVGDFDKCWILAFRGLVDANYDIAAQPKTVRLPVLGNQTIPLPADCLSVSKIGILNEKGEINALKINNALTTWRDNNPNRLQDLVPNINDGIGNFPIIPFYNYYYAGGVYQLYGVGGGLITYGDCRIDERNRVIIFNEDFQYHDVMLEYITAPEKDTDFQVPTCMQEAIVAFVKWKLKLATPQDYYAELTKARRRMPNKKFILQSFNEVIRRADAQKLRS